MAYHGHSGTLETSNEVKANLDGHQIEYNMSRSHYNALTVERPKNTDALIYAMDTINATYGLHGTVVKLNIER